MKILTDEDIPVHLWEEFLIPNPHYTPFQTPGFHDLLNSSDGFSSRAVAVADESRLLALAVTAFQKESGVAGYFSRRAIIYGGMLAEGQFPEAFDLLLKQVTEYASDRAIYTEIRNLSDYHLLKHVFLKNGYKYVPYLNFRVDTRDREALFKRISSSRQRQIRKALRLSVTCSEASSPDEVSVFYDILRQLYRKKLHKPLPEEDFFLKFFEKEVGKYLLVRHNGKIIGGIMCPLLEGKALYEFYVCGLDEAYPELYPSVMATWYAMDYACAHDIPLFDFMGAGKLEVPYGVRDFKERFGGEKVEYGRFIRINRPLLFRIGKTGLYMMKSFGL
jgi:lipid II:glycine glycyltransferase (peptidoglycan interpeptide bridge formation enzyme)